MEQGKRYSKKKFPGMKNAPKVRVYKPKKKYEPITYKGPLKYGLSDYQKRTMNEFMKVREGETIEQWKRRTRQRRVQELDEIKELSLAHPLRIIVRNRERHSIKTKNKFKTIQTVEREFDFMRYYGIVINYYSIKYGIRVEDMQLGFYFYSNIPFSKDRFDNAAVLHLGNSAKKLNHFINNGYIEELIHTKKRYKMPDIEEKMHMYQLTKPFVHKLTCIYRTLAKMNSIKMDQPIFSHLSTGVKQIIKDMQDEIADIHTGRKPQDKIK
ncbi:MAG: hypothetical protein V4666_08140 [Bacteroidota bacterium]